jgi:hypothetical protein
VMESRMRDAIVTCASEGVITRRSKGMITVAETTQRHVDRSILPDCAPDRSRMEKSRCIIAVVSQPELRRMTKRESGRRAFETCAGNKQSSII